MAVTPIPDAWLSGFLLANPSRTVKDAVVYWLEQERLEKLMGECQMQDDNRNPEGNGSEPGVTAAGQDG